MHKTAAKIESRKFGVGIVGDVALGTHFCQFYLAKEDLIDVLVPYFAEGLRNNELCMWITSLPLEVEEAKEALRNEVPNLDEYVQRGQIEIVPYTEWYLQGGEFNADRVLEGWIRKEEEALRRGFDGLRLTGNTFWVERSGWESFLDYEAKINDVIGSHRMIALCTYCLEKCTGDDIVDVIKNHMATLIRKGKAWCLVEDVAQRKMTEEMLRSSEEQMRLLVEATTDYSIFMLDPKGYVASWNKGAERIKGYKAEEIVGKHFSIFYTREDVQSGKPNLLLEKAKAEGRSEDEGWRVRKDGSLFLANVITIAIYDEHKNLRGFSELTRDITEIRKHEEEAARLASFPELNPNPVVEVDSHGNVDYANLAARLTFPDIKEIGLSHAFFFDLEHILSTLKSEKNHTCSREAKIGDTWFYQHFSLVSETQRVRIYAVNVDELKKAEESLRQTRDYLDSLLNYANAPIIVWDPDFKITRFNHAFERLTGLSSSHVVGKNLDMLFPEDKKGEAMSHIRRTLAGEYWETVEIPISNADGTVRTVLWNSANIYDRDGKTVVSTIAQGQDITERKQTEEQLRKSQIDLNRAQAVAKIGSWRLDVRSNELLWSDETHQMFGIPKATPMTYETFLGTIHPDDREYVDQKWKAALHGQRYDVEHRIIVNGEVKWVREKAELEFNKDGSLISGFGTVEDITERKLMEKALAQSEERYRALVELSPDAVTVYRERRFVYMNAAGFRLFGASSPDQILGKPVLELVHPDYRELITSHLQLAEKGTQTPRREAKLLRLDGQPVEIETIGTPISWGGRPAVQVIIRDITERKQAENKLRETRDYLDNLLNYANAPIIVWNPEFRIIMFNRAFEHLTGLSSSDVIGKHLDILFPSDRKEEAMSHIRRTVAGEYWETVEIPILCKDGTVRTALWNSANIYDPDGKSVVATIAQGQDITERKRAEEKMLREKEFSETIINSLPGVFYALDDAGRFLQINQEFAQVAKYSPEEILSKMNVTDIFLEKDQKLIKEKIREVFEKGMANVEANFLSKDGVTTPYYFTGVRIIQDGSPILIGMGLNISERVKAEEALRETRDYLDNLLNYANAPIIVWDPQFRITMFNHAFERLTGLSERDVIGKPLDILFPKDQKEEALAYIRRTVSGEYWETVEIPILRSDGVVRTALWNSANISDASGRNVIATIAQGQDITERKKLTEKLKETERMAAIGETAAMVGHDLRNPLQAIAGYTSLMKEMLRTLPSHEQEKRKFTEFILRIDNQIRYTDKIVSDLRDYAAAVAPAHVKTDLHKLINETLSTTEIPENISVSIEIPKSFPAIKVDPLIMRRVLTNLINNAVQAMPKGGKLNVKASRKNKPQILVINVKDTGLGIPKKDHPKIFTPLFTTRAKGQGLGLPVCKRLVEAHNGTITFKSQVGKGSKFTITIPLTNNK